MVDVLFKVTHLQVQVFEILRCFFFFFFCSFVIIGCWVEGLSRLPTDSKQTAHPSYFYVFKVVTFSGMPQIVRLLFNVIPGR